MTISSQVRTAGPFAGNGTVAAFPFAFKVFQASDLLVARTNPDATLSVLALATDFTVDLNADQDTNPGGTIILNAGVLPAGYVLNATSNLPVVQPMALTNQGGFYPKVIEKAVDRLTILIQQLGFVNIRQTVRVPDVQGVAALPPAGLRANKVMGFDSYGNPVAVIPAAQSASSLALQLASIYGSSFVTFIDAGAGAIGRTLQDVLRDLPANIKGYGAAEDGLTDDTAATQATMNSGKAVIQIDKPTKISSTLFLRAYQKIEFIGAGALILAAAFSGGANGALYGAGLPGVKLIDPVIDASATSGNPGINLVDCKQFFIRKPALKKCNIQILQASNAVRQRGAIWHADIDMMGWLTTSIYLSSANGVEITAPLMTGGLEGLALYNASINISTPGGESFGHTGDGFLNFNGEENDFSGCLSHDNGFSGFTTQRFTAPNNSRRISFRGCKAWNNGFDGFDLRGGISAPFSVPYDILADTCHAWNNVGDGFYVVYGNSAKLVNCDARNNTRPGFYIDNSDNVQMANCTASSNAASIASGGGRAGIFVFNSANFSASNCHSNNQDGAVQDWGLTFSGSTPGYSITGGNYENNIIGYILRPAPSLDTGHVSGATASVYAGSGLKFVSSAFGVTEESGSGTPTTTAGGTGTNLALTTIPRKQGSIFKREGVGVAEFYKNDDSLYLWSKYAG